MIKLGLTECVLNKIAVHSIQQGTVELSDEYTEIRGEQNEQIALRTLLADFRKVKELKQVPFPDSFSTVPVSRLQTGAFTLELTQSIASDMAASLSMFSGVVVIAELLGVELFIDEDETARKHNTHLVAFINNYNYSALFMPEQTQIVKYITQLSTAVLMVHDVALVISTSESKSLQYAWRNFLNLEDFEYSYTHTNRFIKALTSLPLTEIAEFEPNLLTKAKNELNLLANESYQFDVDDFVRETILDQEAADEIINELQSQDIEMSFNVNADALRKNSTKFRSVFKLDNNFHVYIHGGRENIETGYDEERKMQYMKLFYENDRS